jgi:hypothetical protein
MYEEIQSNIVVIGDYSIPYKQERLWAGSEKTMTTMEQHEGHDLHGRRHRCSSRSWQDNPRYHTNPLHLSWIPFLIVFWFGLENADVGVLGLAIPFKMIRFMSLLINFVISYNICMILCLGMNPFSESLL